MDNIKLFLDDLNLRNLSDRTLESYNTDLLQFEKFIQRDLLITKRENVKDWMRELKKSYAENSINRKVEALSSFYTWAKNEGRVEDNPVKGIPLCKVRVRQLDIFTQEELDRMYAQAKTLRDRLILSIFRDSGLRLRELAGILKNNIRGNEIKIVGKGNKERITFVSDSTRQLIETYIKQTNGSERLFNIGARAIQFMMTRLIKCAKIDRPMSCHSFRRTWASFLLIKSKGNLHLVKRLGGWASYKVLERYLNLDKEALFNQYNQAMGG